MHHAQVDRLLALWSAINPGKWVTEGPSGRGTWTIPTGTKIDVNTSKYPSSLFNDASISNNAYMKDLTPFWHTQTNYWNSAAATNTKGYTYPEFNGLDMNNTAAVKAAIQDKVNKLYGGPLDIFSRFAATTPRSDIAADQVSLASAESESIQVWEWSARVHVKKYEIGGSFKVLFFLGSIPSDPGEWISAETFVGAFHGFVNSLV